MLGKKKKTEEREDLGIPKLNRTHFEQITKLVKNLGSTNKVLLHWGAVRLDEDGRVFAIYDYSEADEYEMAKHEKKEPLKGIFYMGHGYLTYIPYNWCSEWIRQWEWWVGQNPNHPDLQGLIGKRDISSIKKTLEKIGSR